ncbi:MAG: DUF4956 domain-containing protein [Pseudomonadota bacterium]
MQNIQWMLRQPDIFPVFCSILLSFILSTLIAVTYDRTFRGLSYSKNYIQALILSAIVASTVMQAIGDSLASGLGMMGALAIIRFRTSLKDPKDIIFMFAALASGIACGVRGFAIAVFGSVGFCVAAFILYWSPFGEARFFDGILRFNIDLGQVSSSEMETIIKRYCSVFALITLREMAQGQRIDYAYHVKLKKGQEKSNLIAELKQISSIQGVSMMLQETTIDL